VTSSWGLRWVLTAVFAGTAGYHALRCSVPALGRLAPHRLADRVTDWSHLVMSVAMIAMLWTWTRGDRWGGQLAFFAAFTGWYLVRATDARRARPLRIALLHQGVEMAAMFWMYFTMSPASGSSMGSMPGMDMPGMDHPAGSSFLAGQAVTLGLTGYLAVAALWWVRAATVVAGGRGDGGDGGLRVVFGPVGVAGCQAVMAAAMGTALLASV
jgi:hypothetical protein